MEALLPPRTMEAQPKIVGGEAAVMTGLALELDGGAVTTSTAGLAVTAPGTASCTGLSVIGCTGGSAASDVALSYDQRQPRTTMA